MISTRDVTTFTNLVGFISAYQVVVALPATATRTHAQCGPSSSPLLLLALALVLSASASLVFHASEAAQVPLAFGGGVLEHGLDQGFLVPVLFQQLSGLGWLLDWGRANSGFLLLVDEGMAIFLIFVTTSLCGGIRNMLRCVIFFDEKSGGAKKFHRLLRAELAVAVVAILVSDLWLTGWGHALLHGLWHVLAFRIPAQLLRACWRDPEHGFSSFHRNSEGQREPYDMELMKGSAMRDPLSHIFSFLCNPGPLRRADRLTVEAFNQAAQLELNCAIFTAERAGQYAPVLLHSAENKSPALESALGRRGSSSVYTPRGFNGYPVFNFSALNKKDGVVGALHWTGLSWTQVIPALPQSLTMVLKEMRLVDLENLTSIGDNFPGFSPLLECATFKNLPKLWKVGNHWLSACSRLTTAHFEGLDSLTTVGSLWLACCPKLNTVTFKGLPNLQAVGLHWGPGSLRAVERMTVEKAPILFDKDAGLSLKAPLRSDDDKQLAGKPGWRGP